MEQNIINKLEFLALTDPHYLELFSIEELSEYLPEGIINVIDEDETDFSVIEVYVNTLVQVIDGPHMISVDLSKGSFCSELLFKKNDAYYCLSYSERDYFTLEYTWEQRDYEIIEMIPREVTITEYIPKNGNTYISSRFTS